MFSPATPSDPAPSAAPAPEASTAALPLDERIRVLCPGGIDPAGTWPAGTKPLMAYIVYAPLSQPNPRPTLP